MKSVGAPRRAESTIHYACVFKAQHFHLDTVRVLNRLGIDEFHHAHGPEVRSGETDTLVVSRLAPDRHHRETNAVLFVGVHHHAVRRAGATAGEPLDRLDVESLAVDVERNRVVLKELLDGLIAGRADQLRTDVRVLSGGQTKLARTDSIGRCGPAAFKESVHIGQNLGWRLLGPERGARSAVRHTAGGDRRVVEETGCSDFFRADVHHLIDVHLVENVERVRLLGVNRLAEELRAVKLDRREANLASEKPQGRDEPSAVDRDTRNGVGLGRNPRHVAAIGAVGIRERTRGSEGRRDKACALLAHGDTGTELNVSPPADRGERHVQTFVQIVELVYEERQRRVFGFEWLFHISLFLSSQRYY